MRFALLLFLLVFLMTGPSHASRRVALVIGNNEYQESPLKNPVNDASDMAVALKSLGFSVTLVKNGDRERMEQAIDAFGQSLKGCEIGLFYFAGHGAEVKGINYIFPVRAKINNEADVRYRAVDAGYVLAEMESAGAGTSIVILDACRNNPFTRRFRSGSRGLAVMDAPLGSVVAFATAPGKVAADGAGRNGVYTKHLLENIRTPGLSIRNVLLKTRIGVVNETGRKQIPWDASSLMGEVFLAGPGNGKPERVAMAPLPREPKLFLKKDKHKKGDALTEPMTGMEFMWVPSGCFQMGSDDGENDEKPVHEVCLDGFWMGKFEVTNAQYRQYRESHDSKDYKGYSLNGNEQPAVYVSWDDANAYAKWLSSMGTGKFRLPTEAEWEYAARAGTQTVRYWGDDEKAACEYGNAGDMGIKSLWNSQWGYFDCNDGFIATAPVGSFRPNDFGLYDMFGNVLEWGSEKYSKFAYSQHSHINPAYTGGGVDRNIRGGSWRSAPIHARSADRGRYKPDYKYIDLGFRLVREE